MPTMIRLRKAPRCEFCALQRFRNQAPFLLTPFRKRPVRVAFPTGSPALRVWLPSRRHQRPEPWKHIPAPNTHGLYPSKLSSGSMIGDQFLEPPSAHALSCETRRPHTGASAASSHRTSRTLGSPGNYPGAGPTAFLGFWPLGLSLRRTVGEASLFPKPLSPFLGSDVAITYERSLRGCSSDGLAVPLRRGCRPVWPFPPTIVRHPLR